MDSNGLTGSDSDKEELNISKLSVPMKKHIKISSDIIDIDSEVESRSQNIKLYSSDESSSGSTSPTKRKKEGKRRTRKIIDNSSINTDGVGNTNDNTNNTGQVTNNTSSKKKEGKTDKKEDKKNGHRFKSVVTSLLAAKTHQNKEKKENNADKTNQHSLKNTTQTEEKLNIKPVLVKSKTTE